MAACASTGDPPGGPPDDAPPQVLATDPDTNAVLDEPPGEANVYFDEVISERIVAQRNDISGAILLSPATGDVRVRWHRNRLSARPREGFQPERIYRLELLPVIQDLRQNRIREGRTVVFSTGPAIPHGVLSGAMVDWQGGRPAPLGLIEAVLLPDSLPYRTLTDSAGAFRMAQMPTGTYVVYGVMDTNGDRRRDGREAYDTVRVAITDSADTELYAFVHDTTGPRIRTTELFDSNTVRLTFDRPLDPATPLDTGGVHIAPSEDSTARVTVAAVYTQRQLDSARTANAAATAAARQARPGADTTGARPVVRDTAGVPPLPRDAEPPRAPAPAPARDSSRAQRMLAGRPSPTDVRYVRLAAPLVAGVRYTIMVTGVHSLTGATNDPTAQLSVPRPRAPAGPPRADTTVSRDSSDTTPAAAAEPPRPR